jgi:hypothetical protein
MIYTLMNKDAELFDMEMGGGNIYKTDNFREENKKLFPIFLHGFKSGQINTERIIKWWKSRRIPESRDGIKELFFNLNNMSLDALSEKSLGLSLSDQYWIRPSGGSAVKWKDVNFFQNDFSEDIGDLLIFGEWNGGSLISPDNSSDGAVKKRWKIIGGERYLIKAGSNQFYQPEPFREVFASRIAKLLFQNDFFAEYDFIFEENDKTGKKVYCLCKNFIDENTEYVPFSQFNEIESAAYNPENFEVCKKIYGEYGHILDLILILDYIVLNEDRHFGNFGMIRSADTGELKKPAPVFDTGASLFYDSVVTDCETARAKPFFKDFEKQIKLVNVSAYRENILKVQKNAEEIFWEAFKNAFEDKNRLSAILDAVKRQIGKLLL